MRRAAVRLRRVHASHGTTACCREVRSCNATPRDFFRIQAIGRVLLIAAVVCCKVTAQHAKTVSPHELLSETRLHSSAQDHAGVSAGDRRLIRKEVANTEALPSTTPGAADSLEHGGSDNNETFNLGKLMSSLNIQFACEAVTVELPGSLSQQEEAQTLQHAAVVASLCGTQRIQKLRRAPRSQALFEKSASRHSGQAALWQAHGIVAEDSVVVVERWNGQLGNRLFALGSALVFAMYVGAQSVQISGFGYEDLFSLPHTATLHDLRKYVYTEDFVALHDSCHSIKEKWHHGNHPAFNWWTIHCNKVPVRVFRDLLKNFVRPRLTEALRQCVNARPTSEEAYTLTAHYRGGDDVRVSEPCSLVDLIYDEGHYSELKVVSAGAGSEHTAGEGEHPCIPHHRKHGASIQSLVMVPSTCDSRRHKAAMSKCHRAKLYPGGAVVGATACASREKCDARHIRTPFRAMHAPSEPWGTSE
eukprot:TRINITY_DN20739_c0_g1_i1.p1 TRINITY_DN20739_c0_g1~~TRINITY_DN20739_c0_g1_i1.p1  ORF type:complete len:474 (+),score=52.46 TRINITY_DN20739_c0_g1_i1:48-1469(+)